MRVLTSICFIIFTLSSSPYAMGANTRRLVGGYSSANTKSEEIDRAAQLVLQKLQQGSGPTVSYSSKLHQIDSNRNNESLELQQSLIAVPLEASQQVVAGMNYKMKVGIFIETSGNTKPGSISREVMNSEKHKKCIGGISATVYRDLRGGYSVTTWGSEIECDQVLALMKDNQGEE